jgi:hypothetical protein
MMVLVDEKADELEDDVVGEPKAKPWVEDDVVGKPKVKPWVELEVPDIWIDWNTDGTDIGSPIHEVNVEVGETVLLVVMPFVPVK